MPYSKKFIDDIRAAADIVQIVGEVVELKAYGDRHKGLCPIHGDKTPSLSVSAERKLWYCFGCGEGGDAISFVQAHQSISFVKAVKYLAERYGLSDDGDPARYCPRPKLKQKPMVPPIGYVPPSKPYVACRDPVADRIIAEYARPIDDHDQIFLTMGVVPTHLIEEIANDVGLSHL
jgi:CHC2 zinc finger